jgi:hypothetical protein
LPPFPAHYASFFLCCVCISLDINASFEGGYTAFLPPSPSSIVTCHPRFIVVKCLRYDAPPLRPLSNGQISHCDNIVPQQLIVVLCLPPHSKTFQMFTAHPRPVNPSMLCPCAPSNNICMYWRVFFQGQVQFEQQRKRPFNFRYLRKTRKNVGGLWHRMSE